MVERQILLVRSNLLHALETGRQVSEVDHSRGEHLCQENPEINPPQLSSSRSPKVLIG
jgi:hypothetical protein